MEKREYHICLTCRRTRPIPLRAVLPLSLFFSVASEPPNVEGVIGVIWSRCNAMARMDSLECLGYWDLVDLLVSNRGINSS
jgi:hypothetical protein